ncbi:holin [Salmonella phage vB_SpuP_Spp16]|uniref:Holin n=1 Tax=Salmonella phage vB_SpuP_Spp16 TaxID=2081603 RepID=A0A346RPD2_9CAUD|nr:holin [Salmonella phage vB_SpuP_Spp16]AXS68549.1 holin [Salmonella phage vB_SpuP_Spp16]
MQGGLTLGVSVSTISLFGVPLNEWVYILTIIILLTQLIRTVVNVFIKIRRGICQKN